MKSFETFVNSFRNAWELVVDVRWPLASEDDAQGDPVWQAALIPLCGCALGVLIFALGILLPSQIAGSILWAFAALVILELKDSGRGLKFVSGKCAKLLFKENHQQFVPSLNTALMLLKIAALIVIGVNVAREIMIVLLTSVFAVESYLAVSDPVPVIDIEEREKRFIWGIPVVIAFFAFWTAPLFTVASAALPAGIVWYFKTHIWKENQPVSGDDITLVAGVVELTLLVVAMLIV